METRASSKQPLSPEEAEAIVEQRIQEFGLGALPAVSICERDGRWHIASDGKTHVADPMNEAQWLEWLEQNVGEVDPEALSSSEG